MPELRDLRFTDFDGDGLIDLWGDSDGQVRAFCGTAPEVWRTMSPYGPAHVLTRFKPVADLDDDGIGDVLHDAVSARLGLDLDSSGTRTLIARSGGDGRVLWKTSFSSPWGWFEEDRGGFYRSYTFPLSAGDFDGDGLSDVVVKESPGLKNMSLIKQPASLPLHLLSGRTGRLLWLTIPLTLGYAASGYAWVSRFDARVIRPGDPPDLIVQYINPFRGPSVPPATLLQGQTRLARVSGRHGRILWDVPVSQPDELDSGAWTESAPPSAFGDLDGDGSLDILVSKGPSTQKGETHLELRAISLLDGRTLWTHRIEAIAPHLPHLRRGDHRPRRRWPGRGRHHRHDPLREAARVDAQGARWQRWSRPMDLAALAGRWRVE